MRWLRTLLERLPRWASILSLLLVLLFLLGTWLGGEPLKRAAPGLPAMKVNTALGLVLASVAMWLRTSRGATRPLACRLAGVCSGLVLALGLVTLLEFCLGWELGIDEFLLRDEDALPGEIPGRMAFNTALGFTLLGAALLLFGMKTRRGHRPTVLLAALVLIIALLADLGYLYGLRSTSGITRHTYMAVNTALALTLLSLGLLAAHGERGLLGIATSDTPGGRLARRMLLAAIGLPLLLGLLVLLGQRHGLYESVFSMSLLLTASITFLVLLVWLNVHELVRIDAGRRQAQEDRALLNLLVSQSGDAIVMMDEKGTLRIFNPEAERLYGPCRKDVTPSTWGEMYGLHTEEGRPLRLEEVPLYRASQGETVRDRRILVHRPDGTRRALSVTATPLRRENGEAAGLVLIARDQTERLALERERAETLALLDALFSAAPVGLAFLDTSLRYVRINDVLAAWNGPPAAEHLGHTPQEILGEPGRELERLLLRVLETGEPIIGHEVSRGPPVDSGPRHTFLVSYFVARVLPEQPRGLGAVVVDITDIKRAEQQLRDAATFRERFLGIVTHDLRSPLHAIRLSTDALAKAEDVPERHRKTVGRIRTNVDWMVRMIDELLDFTRSRLGGGIPISPREVDLRELVQQRMEEARLSHPERAITLSAEGDFLGYWDADRLTQVVSNLVGNALQHSPAGTPVEVRLACEGERVRLEVHNQGPQIPSELLPHVFDPFRGAKKQPSKEEGLGLGLYIVQQIIQAHGGRIDVSSSEEGTSFRVELPPRVPPTKG